MNERTRTVMMKVAASVIVLVIISPYASAVNNNSSIFGSPRLASSAGDASVNALLLTRTSSRQGWDQDGVVFIYDDGDEVELLVFGEKLNTVISVKFSTANNSEGGSCTGPHGHYQVKYILT